MHLADAIRMARPNAGHHALARLQNLVPRLSIITQNIDNLHQAAGSVLPELIAATWQNG